MVPEIDVQFILVGLPVILISLTVHEIAHGYTAYRLGDLTAKNDGRLSLNPLRHIDPLGLIIMILYRFGWAKPVMVNPNNLKNPKKDMALISVAGPASNIVLSILFFIPLYALMTTIDTTSYLFNFLVTGVNINIVLAVFNCLPVPPLDGSKIFGILLPDRIYYKTVMINSIIGMGVLLLLMLTGVLSMVIMPMRDFVLNLYIFAANTIVGLFI